MQTGNPVEQLPQNQIQQPQQAPRLPRIDPLSFTALNTLDQFIARAPLTRQEHAEANKSIQLLVQTIELHQAAVEELSQRLNLNGAGATAASPGPDAPASQPRCNGTIPADDSTVVAEVAEEILRKSR